MNAKFIFYVYLGTIQSTLRFIGFTREKLSNTNKFPLCPTPNTLCGILPVFIRNLHPPHKDTSLNNTKLVFYQNLQIRHYTAFL